MTIALVSTLANAADTLTTQEPKTYRHLIKREFDGKTYLRKPSQRAAILLHIGSWARELY